MKLQPLDGLLSVRTFADAFIGLFMGYALCIVLGGLRNWYFHPLSRYPGPRWAAFSTWWKANLEVFQGKNLAEELVKLHAIYGDVVRIGPNELHFSSPEVYHEIYNSRNRWSRDPSLYHVFAMSLSLLTMMDYPSAKKRRDILQPLFSHKAIQDLQHLVQAKADDMCNNFERIAKQGKSVDIYRAFRCFVVDSITSFCFGTSQKATEAPDFVAPLVESMHASMNELHTIIRFPLLKKFEENLPGAVVSFLQPKLKGLLDMRQSLKHQVAAMLKHPEILLNAPHPTIFHELLNEEHAGHKIPTFTQLRDEALLMVFAGTDTVSNTHVFATMHVLDNPDVHMKLKSELLQAWPKLNDRPSYGELESLPYMRAVIKEALRLGGGPWTPLTRIVPQEGARLGGHFVPGGSIVGMSSKMVHLDPCIFPDPLTFKPERWLESHPKSDEAQHGLDHWLVSFGKGPRGCLAPNLAWCELILGLANVFRRFDLELTDGMRPSKMVWVERFTPHYTGPPMRVRVTPRSD